MGMQINSSIPDDNSIRSALQSKITAPNQESVNTSSTSTSTPLRSDEQEPVFSQNSLKLSSVDNDDTNSRSSPIRNTEEAQKVLDQLKDEIKQKPVQAQNSQAASAEFVAALLTGTSDNLKPR